MLFIPSLFLLSSVLCGASALESTPMYEYVNPSTGRVLLCAKCPPGEHMVAHCTATAPTECRPCREEHYTDLWNYLPKCLYCSTFCTENQQVESECSAVSDRVCRCNEGFYMTYDFCIRHSECKPGHGVITKGTSHVNTVCKRCSDGYFSNSSSAVESCVKHQECANGLVLIPGSAQRDTVCGSCQDLANGGELLRRFLTGFLSMSRVRPWRLQTFFARYIHKSGEESGDICDNALPKPRGLLPDQIRGWLDQMSDKNLKKLPQLMRDSNLNSIAQKLEKSLKDIEQQSTNCGLTL